MERIITYDEIPESRGQKIYLRMSSYPRLYLSLLSKGYRIVNHPNDFDEETIYITGIRLVTDLRKSQEYIPDHDKKLRDLLKEKGIEKPLTRRFSYQDLIDGKYKVPFVLKNETINGGNEKFLIATEEDYENLIKACKYLISGMYRINSPYPREDLRNRLDYREYLDTYFSVQEYVQTPTEYNTSIRVITSSSDDLLGAFLKYSTPAIISDNTTLLGVLLSKTFPLSTRTIMSNTLKGGRNILIGGPYHSREERRIIDSHEIPSEEYDKVITAARYAHTKCKTEMGIICGYDFIYDKEKRKWLLLEYHSKPMVGDYAVFNGLPYKTPEDIIESDSRARATALSLTLKKK